MKHQGILIIEPNDYAGHAREFMTAMDSHLRNVNAYTLPNGKKWEFSTEWVPFKLKGRLTYIFSKLGNINIKRFLPNFMDVFADELNFLGYVLIVDVGQEIKSKDQYLELTKSIEMVWENSVEEQELLKGWLLVPSAYYELQKLIKLKPHAPIVIAVCNHSSSDSMSLSDLQKVLEIDDKIPLISYSPDDMDSINRILLRLAEEDT